jgi:hypothetical protein
MTGISVSSSIDTSTVDSFVASQEEQAVERVLCSRYFQRAPLLSAFLVYVCQRAVEDASARISEHEIGVSVFHRASSFDPREDNIVRTYARQLRKRLDEYYSTDGEQDALRIEIPRGGYVPVFTARAIPEIAVLEPAVPLVPAPLREVPRHSRKAQFRLWLRVIVFLVLYSVAFLWIAQWVLKSHRPPEHRSPLHSLWTQLFSHDRDTFLVPGDTGFVILQQVNHRTFSLAEYLSWFSVEAQGNALAMSYLKDQTYTSMLNLKIVSSLQRLPEAIPDRFVIRATKDIHFDDLRDGNAILLGSNYSNPWDELFQDHLNFRFVNDPKADRYWIVNRHPKQDEVAEYASETKSFSHKTYAVLAFVPNLNKTGHVLLVQGLDAAGTQAAADMLFNGDELQPLLTKAMASRGHLEGFEFLVEANSLDPDSHATSSHVVASRFYP